MRLPASVAHMLHTALCCLLAPKKPARHARGVGCMQRRSSTLLCACYWSDTLANTCLLFSQTDCEHLSANLRIWTHDGDQAGLLLCADPPGFSHSPRYTYGLSVCTRMACAHALVASGKSFTLRSGATRRTTHVHGPPVHVAVAIEARDTKAVYS